MALRGAHISAAVVRQLKDEGIYPYPDQATSDTQAMERRTFDVVVTVARDALASKGAARRLSVDLIRSALESSPGDLHKILDKVLALAKRNSQAGRCHGADLTRCGPSRIGELRGQWIATGQ
ncbi:MAG: hypothetical protein QOI83_2256 [Streptomycetaceae bacterium]|nr:hypothetical protein [Streptomycetaceae bacterium]